MTKKRYYIAYGSNLNIAQMRRRCPRSKVVGTAVLKDYELLFKGSMTGAYLTIEPKEGSEVPVAVWTVTPKDEEALDRYEGCPDFYYKKEMTIEVEETESGIKSMKTVFVYIMHEYRTLGIPSIYYINTCLEGYNKFGFDRKPLFNAIERSRKEAVKNEERNFY